MATIFFSLNGKEDRILVNPLGADTVFDVLSLIGAIIISVHFPATDDDDL